MTSDEISRGFNVLAAFCGLPPFPLEDRAMKYKVAELEGALLDAMVDRVLAHEVAHPAEYWGCTLCGYTGIWNSEFREPETRREAVRALLEVALRP